MYDMMGLPAPYQNDLAAPINDAAFKAKVGVSIAQKRHLIRRVENTAAHEGRPIQPQTALQVLRERFQVVVFAAFRYSTDPQSVPTSKQFDPSLAAKLAPLSRISARNARSQVPGARRQSQRPAERSRVMSVPNAVLN